MPAAPAALLIRRALAQNLGPYPAKSLKTPVYKKINNLRISGGISSRKPVKYPATQVF
jgi:hypothetical protein